MIDGKEGPAFKAMGFLEFSPDSKHVTYSATADGEKKGFMVIDGKIGAKYDTVLVPHYSPDSAHLAYGAQKEGNGWSSRTASRGLYMKRSRCRSSAPTRSTCSTWR